MINLQRRRALLPLVLLSGFFCVPASWAQNGNTTLALVDAPQPQPPDGQVQPASKQITLVPPKQARKYAQVIEPWQSPYRLSTPNKLLFSFGELLKPASIVPSLYSAAYEQVYETDPKYGHDAGAFGEKFGASMLRRASVRVFSDGVFASAFHQDPRYYRVAQGNVFHRSLLSARQAFIRKGDDGNDQFNWSGFAGRAAGAGMTALYYPAPSVTGKVVGTTFAYSILTDAGGDLVLEFLPSIIRKFPIMQKLRLE